MKTRLVLLVVTPPLLVAGWMTGVLLDVYQAQRPSQGGDRS